MPADQYLARFSCHHEINNSPLGATVTPYVEALLTQRYAKRTIGLYLNALAHFGHWMKAEALCLESIDAVLTERFVREHLPACTCPMSLHSGAANTRAALRYLLKLLAQQRPVKSPGDDPITAELDRFGDYLQNICGVAPKRVLVDAKMSEHFSLTASEPNRSSYHHCPAPRLMRFWLH